MLALAAIVRCRPSTREGCGEPLPLAGQRRVGRTQVVELPPVRPVVVEAWQYAARCEGCGHRTTGTYPAGLEPERTFGPRIEALLGDFHERRHVSYERPVEVCRDLFGLPIGEGGIDQALRRLAERARPTYEAIGAEVRAGPAIGSDETGARVAGKTAWQWVFRTTAASYHGIVPRRNADAIAASLGDARPEDGVSDLRSPQLGADVSAIFTSLRTTARKRGENLFQALRSVAGPSPLHAAGVPTRADTNCSHNVSIA